jgi:hypothetical protein
MSERVIDTAALPETLFRMIRTPKVAVREDDGEIRLAPVMEASDNDATPVTRLRGLFAGFPDMTVDEFLKRKRADEAMER